MARSSFSNRKLQEEVVVLLRGPSTVTFRLPESLVGIAHHLFEMVHCQPPAHQRGRLSTNGPLCFDFIPEDCRTSRASETPRSNARRHAGPQSSIVGTGRPLPEGSGKVTKLGTDPVPLYSLALRSLRSFAAIPTAFSKSDLLHARHAIIVRHAAQRFDHPASEDRVSLRPVNLQVAACDRGEKHTALQPPHLVHQRDAVPVADVQHGGVLGVHEHRVPRRACQRVDLAINQRVELFPAARAHFEASFRPLPIRKRHRAEMSLAVRCLKFPVRAQMRPAVLEGVACLGQALDAIVKRR